MRASEEFRSAYLLTVIEVDVDGQTVPALEAIELIGPLWVITAWNPYSQELDLETNSERHRELVTVVDSLGAMRWSARGESPDGRWSEDSLAISGLDWDQVRELATRFEQHAVFELRSRTQIVHGCTSPWRLSRELDVPQEQVDQK